MKLTRPLISVSRLAATVVVCTGCVTATPAEARGPSPRIPAFAHVFVIVEEDRGLSDILGSSAAGFTNQLVREGVLATNYHAVVHPGYGDYFALTAGQTFGAPSNCTFTSCAVQSSSLADRLEARGLSWRAYTYGTAAPCTAPATAAARSHDVFLYFDAIRFNPSRCAAHIVLQNRLAADLSTPRSAARLNWIQPGPCESMDNCSACHADDSCAIRAGDAWLQQTVGIVLSSATWAGGNSVLFVTWEEDSGSPDNRVPLIVVGPQIKSGYRTSIRYDHYSLLRTLELAWGLAPLTTHDAIARPIADVIKGGTV